MIKARVVELKAEQILPVNPCAYGVSGLAISETFKKLQDRSEGKSNGSECRLTASREKVSEISIIKDDAELIVHVHDKIRFWEDRVGNASSFFRDNVNGLWL